MNNVSTAIENQSIQSLAIEFKNNKNNVNFERLYNRTNKLIFDFAYKLIENFSSEWKSLNDQDIDDIVSNVYTVVYEKIDTFNENYQFSTWIYTICRNKVYTAARDKKNRLKNLSHYYLSVKHFEHFEDFVDLTKIKSEEKIMKEELLESIFFQIRSLPETQKRAIILKYIEGYKYKEIAEEMDVRIDDVKSYIFQAKTKIRNKIEPNK